MQRFRGLSLAALNALVFISSLQIKGTKCTATTCAQGYEYQCQWVTNSTGCIDGCNATVTQVLAPGSCKGNCCTMCFLDCFMCVYVKVFVIKITNQKWTAEFADTKSESFRTLEKDLDKAITHYFSRHATENYGLTLLEVEGNSHDASVSVFMMLTSRNKWSEDKSLDLLKAAADNGHLGQFSLQPYGFKVMEESEYRYKAAHKKPFSLDITETVVTCFAASIIISAIIGILYLYCTTPSQRCISCRRSRIH